MARFCCTTACPENWFWKTNLSLVIINLFNKHGDERKQEGEDVYEEEVDVLLERFDLECDTAELNEPDGSDVEQTVHQQQYGHCHVSTPLLRLSGNSTPLVD